MRDAVAFVICALGAVASAVAIPSDVGHGLFGLAFFGGGAVVLGAQLVAARRDAAALRRTDEEVLLAPGTRLQVDVRIPALAAFAFLALGISFPPLFPGVVPLVTGVVSAAFGGLALLSIPFGWYRRTIAVTPEGLRFEERRRRYLVPWDGLQIRLGELHGNAIVLLTPARLDAVLASVEPAQEQVRAARAFGSSLAWVGAPILIMPSRYRVGAAPLAKAFARYVVDRGAREELRERPLLA